MLDWLKKRPPAAQAAPASSSAAAHLASGRAYHSEGLYREAAQALRAAVEIDPALAAAHGQLGLALSALGDRNGARAAFDAALRLEPESVEVRCNRALLMLAMGDFADGWREFEWRWRRAELQTLRGLFPMQWWDGSDLCGRTILLFSEQGFGDAIQFVRYAPLVARQGARVVLDCHPPLQGLFARVEGVSAVLKGDDEIPGHALCAPLMSLPRLFGTTPGGIPAEIPYLAAPPERRAAWRAKIPEDDAVRIGLCWASGSGTNYAWRKSMPLEALEPLARVPRTAFYSLQTGRPSAEAGALRSALRVADFAHELRDFSETAALIGNLDLVISVDTAVAHLAGAMGVPTWTVLPVDADWRWGDGGESRWYPGMTLFRQTREGDWDAVAARMTAPLERFVARTLASTR